MKSKRKNKIVDPIAFPNGNLGRRRGLNVSGTMYLIVMVGVIVLTSLVAFPALMFKRCPGCGKANLVDVQECRGCGCAFPDEDI